MYAQQPDGQPGAEGFDGAPGGGTTTEDSSASSAKTSGDDGVIDADYTMMDDDKKN
jgi:hypothetical protein